MTSTSRPRSPARTFLLYQLACWGVLGGLAYGAVPDFPWIGVAGVGLVAVCSLFPLMAFFAGELGWRRYPTALFRLFVVRPVLYAQLLLPIVTLAAVLGLVVGAVAGSTVAGGRIAALSALLLGATVLLFGWIGSRRLVVREVDAFVPGLPQAFDGLRIAQVSDTHMGPQTSAAFMSQVTRTVKRLEPDIVTVTGDLVDDRSEDVGVFSQWLASITSVDATGHAPEVYLIPGNHDVYAGWGAVAHGLRRQTSAHLLVNEARVMERNGERLAIVGIGDPAAGRGTNSESPSPNIPAALSQVPDDVPVIAFAHNPALWPALAARGVALTLSGHTHWGQFALPRHGWSLASPFLEHAMGAHQSGDSLLYVHPGTGFWGIPFRIGAYPEVALITLRHAAVSSIAMGRRVVLV